MADLDEFTKLLLDKIINNVISCLPMIENMFKDQNKELGKDIGIVNRKDFRSCLVHNLREVLYYLLSSHR